MIVPFEIGPKVLDYTLKEIGVVQARTARCVNWIPIKGKAGWRLLSWPGLYLGGTTANNAAVRGAIRTQIGGVERIVSVHGDTVYKHDGGTSIVSLGTIGSSSGTVSFAESETQILLVAVSQGYVITKSTGAIAAITDANYSSTADSRAAYLDGRFIVTKKSTAEFFLSELNDATDWTPVTSAKAEGDGDLLQTVISNGQLLYMVGEKSIEVWYNAGAASFPFARVQGAAHDFGSDYPDSVALFDGGIVLVGSGRGKNYGVWYVKGSDAKKISTPEIDSVLSASSTNPNEGYVFDLYGNNIYVLRRDGIPTAYGYSFRDDAWFELESNVSGSYLSYRAKLIISGQFLPVAFDYANGKIYQIRPQETNDENGTAIQRIYDFPPIASGNRQFHHWVRFIFEARHDASASYTFSCDLSWSDDAGLTFSTPVTLSKSITTGTTGQRIELKAFRLGSSRERIYRLTMVGPASQIILTQAELDVTPGVN